MLQKMVKLYNRALYSTLEHGSRAMKDIFLGALRYVFADPLGFGQELLLPAHVR